MSYGVLVRSLESSSSYSPESMKEVKVFIGRTDITMKPEGEHVTVKVNGSPIEVPMVERKTIKNEQGHIVAKIIKSKDNVVILKSSKVSVLFDGKRVKVVGSSLLKNKLCGLCGDNNNKKVADVPSPRQCLLSKPKLEVASYRVSLPSKPCSPLPSHLRAELERETERCIKFSSKPTTGISSGFVGSEPLNGYGSSGFVGSEPLNGYGSSSFVGSESLNGYGSQCLYHHHELVEQPSRGKTCFSRLPVIACGGSCHRVGVKEKRVSYTCMPDGDRVTELYATKVRAGKILPELKNMPESYSTYENMPVKCQPITYGGSGGYGGNGGYGGSGDSLF